MKHSRKFFLGSILALPFASTLFANESRSKLVDKLKFLGLNPEDYTSLAAAERAIKFMEAYGPRPKNFRVIRPGEIIERESNEIFCETDKLHSLEGCGHRYTVIANDFQRNQFSPGAFIILDRKWDGKTKKFPTDGTSGRKFQFRRLSSKENNFIFINQGLTIFDKAGENCTGLAHETAIEDLRKHIQGTTVTCYPL